MPYLKCLKCHHEWEGKKDSKCDWCGAGSKILENKTPLESLISDMRPPTKVEINAIFDILVAECGARDSQRADFIRYHTHGEWTSGLEFRFQGKLGFGGKFYLQWHKWWVSCYTEDETKKTQAMIERANTQLAELRKARAK